MSEKRRVPHCCKLCGEYVVAVVKDETTGDLKLKFKDDKLDKTLELLDSAVKILQNSRAKSNLNTKEFNERKAYLYQSARNILDSENYG